MNRENQPFQGQLGTRILPTEDTSPAVEMFRPGVDPTGVALGGKYRRLATPGANLVESNKAKEKLCSSRSGQSGCFISLTFGDMKLNLAARSSRCFCVAQKS